MPDERLPQPSSKKIWVPFPVLAPALAMKAMNKTIPFVSPASPFLAQGPFSPITSSPSISPPNPPRDHQLRLVLPTPNILDRSLLSLQSSPLLSPPPYFIQNPPLHLHQQQQRLQYLQQQEQELTYFPFQAHLHSDDLLSQFGRISQSAVYISFDRTIRR